MLYRSHLQLPISLLQPLTLSEHPLPHPGNSRPLLPFLFLSLHKLSKWHLHYLPAYSVLQLSTLTLLVSSCLISRRLDAQRKNPFCFPLLVVSHLLVEGSCNSVVCLPSFSSERDCLRLHQEQHRGYGGFMTLVSVFNSTRG